MIKEDLQIYLDPPYQRRAPHSRLFAPGDTITGKVVFCPTQDENVDYIAIDFKGKMKAQTTTHSQNRRHTHRFSTDMFHMRTIVFQGPFKMRASTYSYPFTFAFPTQVKLNNPGFHSSGGRSGFEDSLGFVPLPPSFRYDLHEDGACSIYYTLTASIPRTFGKWKDKIPLIISPYRAVANPPPLPRSMTNMNNNFSSLERSFRLSEDGKTPRALTTTESFKNAFHRSKETHFIRFSVSATAPTAIVPGNPYPISLTIQCKDAEKESIMPVFSLRRCELDLKASTDVRVPSLLSDRTQHNSEHIPVSAKSLPMVELPVNKEVTFNGMFPQQGKMYETESFTSWAVRRTYGLELRAVVECLGSENRVKIKWPSVVLFGRGVEDAGTGDGDGLDVSVDVGGGGGEQAPAYREGVAAMTVVGQVEEPLPIYEERSGTVNEGHEMIKKS